MTCGAARQGLAGVDLNRKWRAPQKNLHPTIFYMKARLDVPLTLFRSILLYFADSVPVDFALLCFPTSARAPNNLRTRGGGADAQRRGVWEGQEMMEKMRDERCPRAPPRAPPAPRGPLAGPSRPLRTIASEDIAS